MATSPRGRLGAITLLRDLRIRGMAALKAVRWVDFHPADMIKLPLTAARAQ